MAIVEMKKMTLAGLNSERDAIMKRLQRLACVQVEESEGAIGEREGVDMSQLTARLSGAVSLLKQHNSKKQKSGKRELISVAELQNPIENSDKAFEAVLKLEKLQERARDIKSNIIRLNGTAAQLAPWETLQIPLEDIANTRETWVALGTISAREIGALDEISEAGLLCGISEVSRVGDAVYILIVAHQSDVAALQPYLTAAGFSKAELKFQGSAADNIRKCKRQIAEYENELKSQEKVISEMQGELLRLERLHDHAMLELDRNEAINHMALTETSFMLDGWVPAPRTADVENAIKEVTPDYYIQFEDPTDDDVIPTLLYNNAVISSFESVTDMYSPPAARGFDPNTIMAPFYACFFGMMVSDAAYGVLLALIGFVALRVYNFRGQMGKILGVVAIGGLATVAWGALFGGWFGVTVDVRWFSPMEEPIKMLILCYALGAVHIFTGMGISAYLSFKAGNWQDAVFDQIAWVVMIIGFPLMMFPPVMPLGAVMAAGGALTVLLFAGRDKENFLSRIVGGLGSLYGITGYLSDILSYSRLFAMGLATGVIAMVFNTLAGMMWGSIVGNIFAIVILVVGHVFNLAINTLGAYVHACRLQYIEFYGKFYSAGGIPFKPLKPRTTYVDIQ